TAWEGLIQVLHTYFPRLFVGRRPLSAGAADLLAARLYSRLGYAYWHRRDPSACLWTHLRHLNLAERYPPTRELGQAYSEHGVAMTLLGRFRRAIVYVEKSLALRKAFGDLWGQGQSLNFYGAVLYAASRLTECVAKCREALQILEMKGDEWEISSAHYQLAASLCRLGDFRAAIAEARHYHDSAHAIAAPKRSGEPVVYWAIASGGRVPPEILRAALENTSEVGHRVASALGAEAMRLLAEDRPGAAADVLEQGVARIEKAGLRNQYVIFLYPWLATASRRAAEDPDCSAERRKFLLRRAQPPPPRALRLAQPFPNHPTPCARTGCRQRSEPARGAPATTWTKAWPSPGGKGPVTNTRRLSWHAARSGCSSAGRGPRKKPKPPGNQFARSKPHVRPGRKRRLLDSNAGPTCAASPAVRARR